MRPVSSPWTRLDEIHELDTRRLDGAVHPVESGIDSFEVEVDRVEALVDLGEALVDLRANALVLTSSTG